jgi:hypothetical protein
VVVYEHTLHSKHVGAFFSDSAIKACIIMPHAGALKLPEQQIPS